nr:MAG TPA: hypothetical protein [Caudoviricetes sp.]
MKSPPSAVPALFRVGWWRSFCADFFGIPAGFWLVLLTL